MYVYDNGDSYVVAEVHCGDNYVDGEVHRGDSYVDAEVLVCSLWMRLDPQPKPKHDVIM